MKYINRLKRWHLNAFYFVSILFISSATGIGETLNKENYTDDRKLFLITVMYKMRGFNPAGHDWYWIKYKPDGEVRLEGKVEVCINCHVVVAGNDYVFTGSIK